MDGGMGREWACIPHILGHAASCLVTSACLGPNWCPADSEVRLLPHSAAIFTGGAKGGTEPWHPRSGSLEGAPGVWDGEGLRVP